MNLFKSPEQKITTDSIDKLQFRVVLTADKLLDVFNKDIYENFEIHAYANPQEALEKFHQGIQSIMKKIERDVENFSTIHEVYKKMQKELEDFSLYVEPFDPTTFSVHSIQQSLVQYDSLAKQFRVLRRIFGFEVAKYPDEASSNSSLHHEQYDQVEKHVRHVIQLVQDELKKAKSSKHYPGINAMISRMRLEQKEADFTQLLNELNEYKQKRFGTPPSPLRPDE
jgi:DNA repair exonuclease SbcCD ATPase subunit